MVKQTNGTGWLATQYDGHGNLMATGGYLDEKLTIPQGEFKFYTHVGQRTFTGYNYENHRPDTTFEPEKNYMFTSGYFEHGEKTGKWTTFSSTGEITGMATFAHGRLNGPSQTYSTSTGKLLVEGEYVNDIREGKWNMLSFEGDTMSTEIYKKGEVIKTISFLNDKKFLLKKVKDCKPKYDFIAYLNSHLHTGVSSAGSKQAMYSFTVDTTGHITRPKVWLQKGNDPQADLQIDTAIVNVMLQAPVWMPAVQNNKKVEMYMSFQLNVVYDKKRISVSAITYGRNDARDEAADKFNRSEPKNIVGH